MRTTLTIQIETIDFDTQGCVLRVKGRNIQENQYVKVIFLFSYTFYEVLCQLLHMDCALLLWYLNMSWLNNKTYPVFQDNVF